MNENYDAYAVAIVITFGALIIGGLMAAGIAFHERDAFLLSLGAAAAAWISGYAIFLDRPRTFIAFVGIAMVMAIAGTIVLAF